MPPATTAPAAQQTAPPLAMSADLVAAVSEILAPTVATTAEPRREAAASPPAAVPSGGDRILHIQMRKPSIHPKELRAAAAEAAAAVPTAMSALSRTGASTPRVRPHGLYLVLVRETRPGLALAAQPAKGPPQGVEAKAPEGETGPRHRHTEVAPSLSATQTLPRGKFLKNVRDQDMCRLRSGACKRLVTISMP
jgi:hypothetical protein